MRYRLTIADSVWPAFPDGPATGRAAWGGFLPADAEPAGGLLQSPRAAPGLAALAAGIPQGAALDLAHSGGGGFGAPWTGSAPIAFLAGAGAPALTPSGRFDPGPGSFASVSAMIGPDDAALLSAAHGAEARLAQAADAGAGLRPQAAGDHVVYTGSGNFTYTGTSGDDQVTGGEGSDLFYMQDGGDDTVSGMGGEDAFYYGGALTAADTTDGGLGRDVIILQGDYSAGLTLGPATIHDIEALSVQSATITRWGGTGTGQFSYNIVEDDANVGPAKILIVNGENLKAGEDFTFDGSAETDGHFIFYGGRGTDHLIGGTQSDEFEFDGTRWNPSDVIDGGGSVDSVLFSGAITGVNEYVIGPGHFVSIEYLYVSKLLAEDPSVVPSYSFTIADGNTPEAGYLGVDGSFLTSGVQTLAVDAHDDTGALHFIGGAGADSFIGGSADDILYGAFGQDTLTGGGGADVFQYRNLFDSTPSAPDHITDFVSGTDKIDLQLTGRAWTWSDDGSFHHFANELRATYDSADGWWVVEGDANGDGQSDFTIHVTTATADPLVSTDFVL